MSSDTHPLAEPIGLAIGNALGVSYQLFGATASLLLRAGLCTQADIVLALREQAEKSPEFAADALYKLAEAFEPAGKPDLRLV